MPDPPELPKLPDPLHGLRAGIAAHAATVEAAKQTGAEIQAAKLGPEPGPTTEPAE